MSPFDCVIRNGTVFTEGDATRCDVAILDGRIAAIGQMLGGTRQEIDASNLLVLPGGVDGHVHLEQPMPGGMQLADDFQTGTVSAASGGTTTVVCFAGQEVGRSLKAVMQEYRERASGRAIIDYGFHPIICDPNDDLLTRELPALIREGFPSFKVFMTYDNLKLTDGQILRVLSVARHEGALVLFHAENSDITGWLTDQLEAAGHTAPKYHAASRPMAAEREATHRAITLAEIVGVPILVVHVSGADAAEQIRWAKARGLPVYAETCPQYLFLSTDDLDTADYSGAKYVCSPPPRAKANQQAMWRALAEGVCDIFSSDHSPFRYDDPRGKKLGGKEHPFKSIPNGIPGIAARLPLLFSEGVIQGRTSLQQFVALTARNPAKLFGLFPRKGTIAVGSDADLVLWDSKKAVTITNSLMHHNADYTPYEGVQVTGWPVTTLSRGTVVWDGGALKGRPGHGQFIRRNLPHMSPPAPLPT
jgi:dihydropyrimidinase